MYSWRPRGPATPPAAPPLTEQPVAAPVQPAAAAEQPAAAREHPAAAVSRMVTRPVQRYGFYATHSVVSPVPANYRSALADPQWRAAMADEYKALVDNGT